MKLDDKIKRILLDSIIILIVILVFILIDFLIISLRTSPAEDKEIILEQDTLVIEENVIEDNIIENDTREININEKVFLPILNFHHIGTAPASAGKITRTYYIEPVDFENIIKEIIDNDYESVFVSEIADYLAKGILPKRKIIAISFDDGNKNFITNAWPILEKYKVKSSVYIMTGVGGDNYLNDEDIVELDKSGLVEFGSHTIYHQKLTKISPGERMRELEQSKEELEKLLNKDINILAYPFGLYNEDVKALANALGYVAGLTFDQDAWQDPQDLMELKRISVYPNLNVIKFLDRLKGN